MYMYLHRLQACYLNNKDNGRVRWNTCMWCFWGKAIDEIHFHQKV